MEEEQKIQIVNFIVWIIVGFAGLWLLSALLGSIHTGNSCKGMTPKECEAYSDVMGSNPEFR